MDESNCCENCKHYYYEPKFAGGICTCSNWDSEYYAEIVDRLDVCDEYEGEEE